MQVMPQEISRACRFGSRPCTPHIINHCFTYHYWLLSVPNSLLADVNHLTHQPCWCMLPCGLTVQVSCGLATLCGALLRQDWLSYKARVYFVKADHNSMGFLDAWKCAREDHPAFFDLIVSQAHCQMIQMETHFSSFLSISLICTYLYMCVCVCACV